MNTASLRHETTQMAAAHNRGYFDPEKGAMYYITDWQGNNAAVVNSSGAVVQNTDYYPYGEPTVEPSGQRYLFGGKEREHAAGRNTYDFGARSLTPYGSWPSPDPLAHKFYPISPYSYCGSDPINRVDNDGEFWDTLWDVGNIIYDVGAAIYNHVIGDHETAKEHWVDAAYDTGAAIVPFVPAGASKGLKAGAETVKAIDNTSDAGKVAKASKQSIKNTSTNSATTTKSIHGNSKSSSKAQHLYEIYDKETGKTVKTGISGGRKIQDGKSYRANSQVNKWNREAGWQKFDSQVVKDFPAGPNARSEALNAEKNNADRLRKRGELDVLNYYKRL